MRRTRRGFTLVELTITTALVAVVVGALASLYFYAMNRVARETAEAAALLQAQMLLDRLEAQISGGCEARVITSNGKQGLKVTIPNLGVDRDGDGILDSFFPVGVNSKARARYERGRRVWYYLAGEPGGFTDPGDRLFQAVRDDDSVPVDTDVVPAFSKTGGIYRYPLLDSLDFSVANNEIVTLTVRTSSLFRRDAKIGATAPENRDNSVVTLTRKVFLSNWR